MTGSFCLLVAQSPAARPDVELGAKRVHRAELVVEMAMNRQALAPFPALDLYSHLV